MPPMESLTNKLRTHLLHYRLGSFWATSWTPFHSSAPTAGPSKTTKIDVQQGGDVIHRLAQEVAVILHVC